MQKKAEGNEKEMNEARYKSGEVWRITVSRARARLDTTTRQPNRVQRQVHFHTHSVHPSPPHTAPATRYAACTDHQTLWPPIACARRRRSRDVEGNPGGIDGGRPATPADREGQRVRPSTRHPRLDDFVEYRLFCSISSSRPKSNPCKPSSLNGRLWRSCRSSRRSTRTSTFFSKARNGRTSGACRSWKGALLGYATRSGC